MNYLILLIGGLAFLLFSIITVDDFFIPTAVILITMSLAENPILIKIAESIGGPK